MRIAAYDPGESTGWARCRWDGSDLHELEYGWDAFVPVAKHLYSEMRGDDPYDVVIYESWRLFKDHAKDFIGSPIIPVQAVGFTRAAVLFTRPSTPLVVQEPSIKKVIDRMMVGFGSPDYLPARDGAEHARDAIRHLCYYLVHKRQWRPPNGFKS